MARLFNGTNMRMYSNGTPVTAAPLTLAVWAYFTSLSGRRDLVCINGESGSNLHGFILGMDGNNDRMQAGTGDTSADVFAVATVASLSLNTWFHGCAVFNSSTSRHIFTNGTDKQSNTTSRTPSGLSQIVLGCWARGADAGSGVFNFFAGRLAWASIWNVALDDADVLHLAQGAHPLSMRPLNLVFCAPLYGIDSPEPDWNPSGGAKYSLNLLNAPTAANGPPIKPYSVKYWATRYEVADTTADAAGNMTLSGLALSGAGEFDKPVFSASGNLQKTGLALSGTATFADQQFTASGGMTLSGLALAGTGAFTTPTFAASGNLQKTALALAGALTSVPPTFSASGNLQKTGLVLSGLGEVDNPVYTAEGNLQKTGLALGGAATFSPFAIYDYTGTVTCPAAVVGCNVSYHSAAPASGGAVMRWDLPTQQIPDQTENAPKRYRYQGRIFLPAVAVGSQSFYGQASPPPKGKRKRSAPKRKKPALPSVPLESKAAPDPSTLIPKVARFSRGKTSSTAARVGSKTFYSAADPDEEALIALAFGLPLELLKDRL